MRTRLALLLCLVTSVNACKQAPPAEAALPLPRVRVAPARTGQAVRTLRVSGALSAPPGREVKLAPLVPGRLAVLRVAEGDAVKTGQVLGEVETGPVSAELQQAEATAREAAAAARAAEAKRARTEVLVQHGVAARQEAEQDLSAEAAAVAAEQRARAAVDVARRNVGRSELKAPFDGIVTAVFIRQGEAVDGTGQPVLQVSAVDPVELRAFVPQEDAARVQAGMRASLSVEGQAGARPGEVVAVSPSIDPTSGNVLVRLRFPNPAGALRLGAFGRAGILLGEQGTAITLPSSALLPLEDGGLGVAVVREGKVRGVPVTVWSEEGGQAVVQGPLQDGQDVIVEGGYSLPDGAGVEVVR
ncbi:efflux RND transporter periplasmic adaptor subunit [Pyxidicoccus sp. MSG2]|uniref:efflux RND transporter periplasmic adaptor subunit n=1 Tax=Pyxidicoccus sp. MSG2 TaxID=2996790 RepID=UPI002271DA9F|nr:efflux RND transporter periplasmic adaptor subunit [Pyxidicoccus sp. MSG2]MCY1021047.1 efflux RND transporter periplasmic adaptor subunit [Pyxidicoccus sp. MSG2]